MKSALGGFTIIEALIVLAISGFLLSSAIIVFSSRRQGTEFSQAIYDLQSQLQNLANNTSSHALATDRYQCDITDDDNVPNPQYVKRQFEIMPALTSGSNVGNICIILGSAIQVAPNKTFLYSYPVYGLRSVYDHTVDTKVLPTTPNEAHAEVAIDVGGGVIQALQRNYSLLNGLKIFWAKPSGPSFSSFGTAPESDILTLYSSLQSNNVSGNEINAAAHRITGDLSNRSNAGEQARICVESDRTLPPESCPTSNDIQISGSNFWNLCVGYSATKQALVSLTATATGIVSKVKMSGCT
jgi:type II secretory pathway pseudopilin PulG